MDTQREAALIQEIDTLRGELKSYQSREAEWERAKQERQQIDITERKQAEEQLRYQATLLANVNDAIVASDSQYRLTAWNAAAEALYGWKAEEVLGRNGLEITRTEWPGVEAEEMRRRIAEAGRWRGEATQARRDGTRFPVEVSCIVLRTESGQITGYVSVNHDITERKQAEEALRESEQRYRLLVDNASEAIVVIQDGILKFTNRMASDLTGYSEQELTSRPFSEFIHPDDRGMVIERYLRAMGDVDQLRYIFRLIVCDGSIKWVEIGAVLIDWEGSPAILIFLNDITEHKRVVQELWESEQKYRLLVDNASEAIVVAQDGILKFVNRMASDLTGYSEQELTSRPFPEFIHPDDRDMVTERYLRRIKGDVSQPRYVFRLKVRDGSIKWVEIGAVLVDWEGRPATLNFLNDITERKRAEEALRASEEQLRLVTDNMLDMVVRTDLQGIFLYASPSHENVLGYEPASLLGTSIYDFMHPEDIDRVRNEVLSNLQAETPGKQEYRYRHADGHYIWLESIGTLIYDDDGSPIGAVFSTRNLTERKQAEMQLNEQLEELRRWHQATLGREMRVIDLKREVNELLVKAGQPLRYPSAETENQ